MTMVPEFPRSALACELSPEALIDALPAGEMSSDYQWLSLKAWNPEAMVSQLDGAMIVGFADYHDEKERFFGFTGGNDPVAMAVELLSVAERRGWCDELRLVPAQIATLLVPHFQILADRDNFDYIYDPQLVCSLDAPGHRLSRKHRNGFRRRNDDCYRTTVSTVSDAPWRDLIDITERWATTAKDRGAATDEIKALIRCATTLELYPHGHDTFVTTLDVHGRTLGFDITELTAGGWAINHFRHTPHELVGAHVELRTAVAQHLCDRGSGPWNAEQDLGVDGLRARKLRDRPSGFVQKYTVRTLPHD